MVTFRVLGPLAAEDDGRPVELRGPRHRAVLARLLVAGGRAVPLPRLVEDLWDSPPDGAAGAVQTFVGALRKALEPGRPPRTPSRLLVTVAGGYALRTAPGAVDADRFAADVGTAAGLLDDGRPADAAAVLDAALASWRGPAYAEFATQPWALGEAARLEELRLLARHRRAEAALAAGRAAETVPELTALVVEDPLSEDAWRLLALAQYRAGRQGDTLATLRRARQALSARLGLDPGPALRQLEADVLAQAPSLGIAVRPPSAAPAPAPSRLVGRHGELAALEAAAAAARAGRPGVALVSGAAGAGKTALTRALADRLAARGWTVAVGAGPEGGGTPPAWPWQQVAAQLGRPGALDVDGTAGPVPARFARHRAVAAVLGGAAAPVLVVLDDLHWADEETLALLGTLVTDPALPRLLIVATHRSTEITAGLTAALARVARAEPVRVYLAGLTADEVAELAGGLTDRRPGPAELRMVHARSAGNPFLARELLRLWEAEGEPGLRSVPAGVRDVLRHRLDRLPAAARTVLRQAAVQGVEVDLDLLVRQNGDEETVLTATEAALQAGFVAEAGADRLRFAHALVQETLYDEVPAARRTRWHAALAGLLAGARPADPARVAGHLLRAGTAADPTAALAAFRSAAARAERRSAPHEAARWWTAAAGALDRLAESDPRTRLEVATGRVRALAVTGGLARARTVRGEVLELAEEVGDPVLTADVLGTSAVPGVWTTNDDPDLSARLVGAAEAALAALPAGRPAERARLLVTVALERRADDGDRGAEAAREAEELARELGDPALRALALDGRYLQSFGRAGLAPERARLAEEVLALAAGDEALATTAVLGHLMAVQARSALGELDAADRAAAAADALADRHGLPLVGVLTGWYAALRTSLRGTPEQARAAYRAAAAALPGSGMAGLEPGLLPLALLALDPLAPAPGAEFGPYEPWARPLVLLAAGDRGSAGAALAALPETPRDLLLEARLALAAVAAVELGDRSVADRMYTRLLPAEAELAGAGSGLLTAGPVGWYLAALARLLDRPTGGHLAAAREVAERAGSPRWVAAARRAAAR